MRLLTMMLAFALAGNATASEVPPKEITRESLQRWSSDLAKRFDQLRFENADGKNISEAAFLDILYTQRPAFEMVEYKDKPSRMVIRLRPKIS